MRILSKKMKRDVSWVQGKRNQKLITQAQEFKKELEEYESARF